MLVPQMTKQQMPFVSLDVTLATKYKKCLSFCSNILEDSSIVLQDILKTKSNVKWNYIYF